MVPSIPLRIQNPEKKKKKLTVWVTGAFGFIGRNLSRYLSHNGNRVIGIGIGSVPQDGLKAWGISEWLEAEVSIANLSLLLQKTGEPETVYHLAGGGSVSLSINTPYDDYSMTVGSTVQLLEWVRRFSPRTRIVLSSSAAVYGNQYSGPIRESDPTCPYSPYGYHKRIAEMILESYSKNYGIPTAIVRLFSVYGPGLQKQLLWDTCQRLNNGPEVLQFSGTGDEIRDWLHIRDAIRLLTEASRYASPSGFLVNGGTGKCVPVYEIIDSIIHSFGFTTQVEYTNKPRLGDPPYLCADISYQHSLGLLSEIDWKDGIEEYVRWYTSSDRSAAK